MQKPAARTVTISDHEAAVLALYEASGTERRQKVDAILCESLSGVGLGARLARFGDLPGSALTPFLRARQFASQEVL